MKKQQENIDDYVTAHEAAQILTVNRGGRRVSPHYVHQMVKMKKYKIKTARFRDRLMYRREDIEECVIGVAPVSV
jgi:hypothetical protein